MKKLMKQMQRAQTAAAEVQDRLAQLSVEGQASGLVRVTMSGQGKIVSLSIDPAAVDPSDPETLEDLLLVAIREAEAKAEALQQQETQRSLGSLTGLI